MFPYFFFFLQGQARVTEYHKKLLESANNLLNQGQYSFAIVISHTACELLVERVTTNAFNNEKVKNFRNLLVSSNTSYNIAADRIKDLYTALTDDNEIQDESFWKPFTDSVKRRNDVVHRGVMFEQSDAQKSLDAVKALIDYLEQKFGMS
jgi:hypothetical protein